MKKLVLLLTLSLVSLSLVAEEQSLSDLEKLTVVQHCIDGSCMIQDASESAGYEAKFITTRSMLKGLMETPETDLVAYEVVSEEEFKTLRENVQMTLYYEMSDDKRVRDPVRCATAVASGASRGALAGAAVGAATGLGAGIGATIGAVGGGAERFNTDPNCKPKDKDRNDARSAHSML